MAFLDLTSTLTIPGLVDNIQNKTFTLIMVEHPMLLDQSNLIPHAPCDTQTLKSGCKIFMVQLNKNEFSFPRCH
jgi:hypothetical protein